MRQDDPADVNRPRDAAAGTYNRQSRVYDYTEGIFERSRQDLGLRMLAAAPGERILEIGYGTGRCLASIAQSVGPEGRVAGIDISEGMRRVAAKRLHRLGLEGRVDLRVGDAVSLPFEAASFDGVFTSFCLELFPWRDIPEVLAECRRVLRTGGRMVVVSLATADRPSPTARLYLWLHMRFPQLVDCRPIPVESLLEQAGLRITRAITSPLFGLPVTVAAAAR